jgi:uncharacterized protein (DUF608 family)
MARQARRRPYTYYGDTLREVAFPLGGIGTGCVSLEGRGALSDWEIYNRPNKGSILPMTFAALWCRPQGGSGQSRVIVGRRTKDYVGDEKSGFWGYGHGQIRQQGDGLPHFSDAVFRGTFPFAKIRFRDAGCPLEVSLEAWSPFIPLNERDSGMPVACLTYKLRNPLAVPVEATVAMVLHNPVGFGHAATEKDPDLAQNLHRVGKHCSGIEFTNSRFAAGDPRHGTAALTSDWRDASWLQTTLRSGWFDALHDLWDMVAREGKLDTARECEPGGTSGAALALHVTLAPGASTELPFLVSWCFPTAEKYWAPPVPCEGSCDCEPKTLRWTNPYAQEWPTAWDAADEFFRRKRELLRRTRAFERAIFTSTLPTEVIESVSATASILRSPTCIRYEDGTFWGWEGCGSHSGCCDGSCTHVWNYALTLAHLFPALHRSMRKSEYDHGFADGDEGGRGAIVFRIALPLGTKNPLWHAASDGQLGGVVQLYRDWRICGDDDYLRAMWPGAKRALEFAWVRWDTDRDGMVDGDQHNTYDINFQGPNPLAQGFYLAALRAGEEIARHLGDTATATEYRRLFDQGRRKAVETMFNGEYFEQALDCTAPDAPKYQHGRGCLSDQMFGQWSAHVAGLGYLYGQEIVRSSMASVFRHNFRAPLGDHANMQRIYAVADEDALLLCSWPRGGRPAFPFPYSDEAWTGIEYQVASHLIHEGMMEEGIAIVRAVRARHDGRRRNPYNEFECGSHYARALSSWGLLIALSGFRHDAVTKETTVAPKISPKGGFRCFFSTGSAWGQVIVKDGKVRLKVIEGKL